MGLIRDARCQGRELSLNMHDRQRCKDWRPQDHKITEISRGRTHGCRAIASALEIAVAWSGRIVIHEALRSDEAVHASLFRIFTCHFRSFRRFSILGKAGGWFDRGRRFCCSCCVPYALTSRKGSSHQFAKRQREQCAQTA
ncbi:hypothetical protein RHECNPAF_770060 [Rhizobium etli CNPAF512]|nr:hypothetical protein RHECNPAF_770060 [Rhizobium etli CNPAF512]